MKLVGYVAYAGLWCLIQSGLSVLMHTGYALHELAMAFGAFTAAGLFCGVVGLHRLAIWAWS
jgi:hypothetical protein